MPIWRRQVSGRVLTAARQSRSASSARGQRIRGCAAVPRRAPPRARRERGRDAILEVAVAGPDLPWLVALAAAVPQLLGGAEQFGRRLGLARLTDDHRRRLQGMRAAPEVAVSAKISTLRRRTRPRQRAHPGRRR